MTVDVIASGSSGNAVLLQDGAAGLLLDCGVPWRQVREACARHGASAARLAAVLVSHEHADHARRHALHEASLAGVPLCMSPGTADALGYGPGDARVRRLAHGDAIALGGWTVAALPVVHDGASEPAAFLVRAPQGDVAAYICDAPYLYNRLGGVTHWLIEANYDPALLPDSLPEAARNHIIGGHMSIGSCLELLRANDLSPAREIHLLHLSDRHSNADEFRRRVMMATGVPTWVGRAAREGNAE